MAALTCSQTERQGDVGFAGAAVAEQQDVFLAVEILASRQFQDQGLVERGDGEEVEAVQALHHREPGLADAALGRAAVAVE